MEALKGQSFLFIKDMGAPDRLFAIGSFYLLINNINWAGYDVFAGYTGGGGVALQFGNKFINSKYNSAPGSYAPNEPCCPPINRNPKM